MRPRGAYVMGRNMFGPIRGEWEEDWRGWWGPEPPYHAPVFVLTHHAREPIEMEGGTTFHFVTDGFDAAYAQARETAGDDGVDIAGGASTVRQALVAGVVDELTLDIAPVLLGSGERIFDGVGSFGLEPVEVLHSPLATHIRYRVGRRHRGEVLAGGNVDTIPSDCRASSRFASHSSSKRGSAISEKVASLEAVDGLPPDLGVEVVEQLVEGHVLAGNSTSIPKRSSSP